MSGSQKIAEVAQDVINIKNQIQKKYDTIVGKIAELQNNLIKMSNTAYNDAKSWAKEKTKKITRKINKLKKDLDTWLSKKLQDVQNWMDDVKKEITEFIAKLQLSKVLAIAGI